MKSEGGEQATWMQWRVELNFTSQQPTHAFMLHGWTEAYAELWEAYEAIYMKQQAGCSNCKDKGSRQPFIAQLEFHATEVSWHDNARHEEAEYRRALSPALTLYRSLEVLGLESLMCGDCGRTVSQEDTTTAPDVPLSISMHGAYNGPKHYGPYLRYSLRSGFRTFSAAEALAGALHACNEDCPVKGGTKQLIRTALHAVTATARDLQHKLESQKPRWLHGVRVRELLPLPRLPVVSDVGCCTAQPGCRRYFEDDEEEEEEAERLERAIKALAKTGSEGHALQLALEVLAWSSDASLQPVASRYCLTMEAVDLTYALRSYVSQYLLHAGKVPAEVTKRLREVGAHVHPSHPSFGNLPAEARARACRLVPFSGRAADLRQYEEVASACLRRLGWGLVLLVAVCSLCLTLNVVQVLAIAEIPLIPVRLAWLAVRGVWSLLRGAASQGDGREAPAGAAADNGGTEPASPVAARGGGRGRKAPSGSPPASASKSARGAATPDGGSRRAVKGRSGSADAPATANGGTGRQPESQQPSAAPPGPQQPHAKPAGGKKRRGSSAYAPAGAAAISTALLTGTPLQSAISEPSTPLPPAAQSSAPSSQLAAAPAPQPYRSEAAAGAAFAAAWDFMPPPPAAAGSAPAPAAASSAPDDDDDPGRLCVMCLDGPRRFGFLHGTTVHTGVCEECSTLLQSCMPGLECPLCRVRVETIVALY